MKHMKYIDFIVHSFIDSAADVGFRSRAEYLSGSYSVL